MFSPLLALCLVTSSAHAAWNLDANFAFTPGANQDGVETGQTMNSAFSPFEQGPQLELSDHTAFFSTVRMKRFGAGLRQELSPTLAVSAHALFVSRDFSDRVGLQGALYWKIWSPFEQAQLPEAETWEAPDTDPTMSLGLYAYGGATPASESVSGDRWWWTGTGLLLSFGR